MERWRAKIAVITGASAGIGAVTAKSLAEKGMIVVGLARREDKTKADVRPSIAKEFRQNFHTKQCDVADEGSVKSAFAWIEKQFDGVDVLINNAGIVRGSNIVAENNSDEMKDTININVMGSVWCSREAFRTMKHRDGGHMMFINSLAGHFVPYVNRLSFNIYAPSKHAVTALAEVLRYEFLREKKYNLGVTSISPSTVDTDIMGKDFKYREGLRMLKSEDIADAIVYCLQTPPHVQINQMIIRATGSKI